MSQIWVCRGCDRVREVDDDGHCVECRTVEKQLLTDGGTDLPAFVDPNAEYVTCYFCGQTWVPAAVDGFDLSTEDEYYPKMVPVCPEHSGGCR